MLQTIVLWALFAVVAGHAALAAGSLYLTHEAEARHPPSGRFVDAAGVGGARAADGRRLHYRESGPSDAPPLVLVHGASTSLLDFDTSLRPRLERDFRVIAVDRPGSGWSDALPGAAGDPRVQADAVVHVLDALGIARATWVGHSWGGAVVMAALLEHPERVRAAVGVSAATHPWQGTLPRVLRLGALPGVGHVLAACWVEPLGRRMLGDAVRGSFRPEPPPEDLDAYLDATGAALTIRPRSFRATALDMSGLSDALARLAPRYGTIARPLLLLSGTEDPAVPPARNSDRVAAALPSAETRHIAGAGHIVHHTHADEVADAIGAFAHRVAGDGVHRGAR